MKNLLKIFFLLLSFLLVLIIIGFLTPDNPTSQDDTELKKIAIYIDKEPKSPENQNQIKIAVIEINKFNGDLTLIKIINNIPEVERLDRSLNEIKKRTGLKLMVENYEMINGQKSLVMKEIGVIKTDPNYIYAVQEALTMEFGFKAEIEKEIITKRIISQGTVGNFGNARIGVISISKSDYIDDEGTTKNGLTAMLSILSKNDYKNNYSENQKLPVYIGKKFTAAEYEFTVDSIETNISKEITGSPSGTVTLLFKVVCVSEGKSLGPVLQGNNLECCPGLISSNVSEISGNRGTCIKPEIPHNI